MDKAYRDKKQDSHNREDKKTIPVFAKYGLIAIAVIIVIAVVLVIYFSVSGNVVARIDGEKITVNEFKYNLQYQKQLMYSEALSVDPNISEETFWTTRIGGEDAVEVAKKKTLDALKDSKVQYNKAKEANISMTKEEKDSLDNYIKVNIIDVMGGGNKLKANKAFEEEYGFPIDVMKDAQIQSYIVYKFKSEQIGNISDADADVDSYYDSNPEWYKEDTRLRTNAEEAVWARHILVAADEATATQEEKDTAKKSAEDLIDKLKAGDDFVKLIGENSADPGSSGRGGDYVFGMSSTFYESFKKAAFALEPGEFTQTPVLTGAGYHIIMVDEKYAQGEPVSLKCAKEYYEYGTSFIKVKLYERKLADWVKGAEIKMNSGLYASIK